MKNNPYATNKGGVINSVKNVRAGDPKASAIKGTDLRTGK